jgi:hypothetical protein
MHETEDVKYPRINQLEKNDFKSQRPCSKTASRSTADLYAIFVLNIGITLFMCLIFSTFFPPKKKT